MTRCPAFFFAGFSNLDREKPLLYDRVLEGIAYEPSRDPLYHTNQGRVLNAYFKEKNSCHHTFALRLAPRCSVPMLNQLPRRRSRSQLSPDQRP